MILLLIMCVCLDCRDIQPEETYFDRDVEKAFMKASADLFESKTQSSLLISNQNGNMYTPSVYGCLASLISQYVSVSDFCLTFIHSSTVFNHLLQPCAQGAGSQRFLCEKQIKTTQDNILGNKALNLI